MKVTNSKQLSVCLKEARLHLKLTQSKVGKKIGIRQDTVSNFEQNPDSTKLETLFKILSALNLELDIKIRNTELSQPLQDNHPITSEDKWKEEW